MKKYQEYIDKSKLHILHKDKITAQDEHNKFINKRVEYAKTFFDNYDLATIRASYIKNKALENCDTLLANFEFNLKNTRIKVIWATDAQYALTEISEICKQKDLPLYIDDKKIFQELCKGNEELLKNIHQTNEINQPYISVTEANFIVADSSSIVCFNDNNQSEKLQANAHSQIFVCEINNILSSFNDIELIASLYSTNKFGEPLPSNICIYNGNKNNDDDFLTDDIFLILLDNGRTHIMADHEQRSLLNCLHCNACTRVCPVTLYAGEDSSGTIYTGPYGSLVSYALEKNDEYMHLPYASTVFSGYNEVCPMHIDLTSLLYYSRRNAFNNKQYPNSNTISNYLWKKAVMKRSNMNKFGPKFKGFVFKQMMKKSLGNSRVMPQLATKSFNELWRERKN
ncbi:MAG: lactate utilization protein [Bacteroidia bacterium]|nr:lactate utilization protein [Bacteroidia bacterium]MCZ2247363.1 LUD domain-containing protein [Bacteroidia bacterium]